MEQEGRGKAHAKQRGEAKQDEREACKLMERSVGKQRISYNSDTGNLQGGNCGR